GAVGNKEALDKVDIAALTSGNLLQVELTDGAKNSTIYTINVTKNLDNVATRGVHFATTLNMNQTFVIQGGIVKFI
ncbi:hypothetical protein H9635_03380, partial [Solibacillus sp. A46]